MKLNLANRRTLVDCINTPKITKGVEVGVRTGWYSKYILDNSYMTLDSVDPWEKNEELSTPEECYEFCKNLLLPYGDRSKMIKGYSPSVCEQYENESLDFVYIDGLHTYEAVKADIEGWYPKVKKNRLICGHDFNPIKWIGVVKAVNEFCKNNNLEFYLTGTVGNAISSKTGDVDEFDGDEQSWVVIKK